MTKQKQKLILSMLIFGTIGLVRRGIPYSSTLIAFGRGVIGVAFLLGLNAFRKRKPDYAAIRQNLRALVLSGAFIGINWIFLFEAYRYTSVSVATVCYYMAPIFMILAAPVFLKDKLTVKKGLCAAAALLGMVLVSGVLDTGITGGKGMVYGLAAAVLYAGVILLNKTVKGMEPMDRTAVQLLSGTVVLFPYLLLTENLSALTPDPLGLALLVTAGILHTGFAYALYFGSIEGVPTQTVAIFSYIDPVTALLLSALLLHETMNLPAMLGVVLVIGAALCAELVE